MSDLAATSTLLALFADPTRMRLLCLLERDELSVAELTRVTAVPQPRVSTHLGKLKEAGLIRDRRVGTSTFYRMDIARLSPAVQSAWRAIASGLDDATITDDAARCEEVMAARTDATHWADAVAGQMEHHYSPGRTWEATARAFVGLVNLGDVLDVGSGDGVLAQLLAPRARRYVCLDRSAKVIDAAQARLGRLPNVEFVCGDMHAIEVPDATFDHVLSFSVLTYAEDPQGCIAEWFRVLRPGGSLVLVTLDEHRHGELADAYEHIHHGFAPGRLAELLSTSGFAVERCDVAARERRKPYFDVVCAFARRPDAAPSRAARTQRRAQ
jgi:ArsR family transcriptional regulator